jgi:hypothetical protein
VDRDRLQSWLQIASNIGLLIGLILVGVQIKQTSDLTRRTLLESAYQPETAHMDTMMGEHAAASLARAKFAPDALTPADVHVLLYFADWHFAMMRRNAQLEELGMFDSSWRWLLPVVGAELGRNPVTRKYLLEAGDQIAQAAGDDWMKAMQDAARATPPDSGKQFIDDLLRTANARVPAPDAAAPAQAQEQ